ncbi:glycosyltransferase family 2 protein [Flavobacterium ginsenosidimutans]|uniref:Glycosyltransferase family 2 protein n=1 Tax=Flavobacterium ginsenosidimutans TaxID=687844 RepID=A0ABZ2QI97_9FLAO|nr:glycosyltransferase family 2 protein [Flavobacterium ginsenosidimutans]KAF2335913.1 glycosyltransferase family 2 protein [Flavobacterium ginsenosidimutans]
MTIKTNLTNDFSTKDLNPKVYIVILNYRRTPDTIECIESLLEINYSNYQVLVIDNSEIESPFQNLLDWASLKKIEFDQTDEKRLNLIENQKQIVFIKSEKNKGFASGNNIGLRAILDAQKGDSYIWLLNNDTIVDKDSLKEQILYLMQNQHSKIGILGSKLIYYFKRDSLQAVGGRFNKKFFISEHIGEGESTIKSKSKFEKIDYVIGASMFVTYKFLKEVGTLNEDFFLYYEELDWAYRAQEKGWFLDWCPDSLVFHKEGASIGSSYDSKKKSFFSEVQIFKSRKIFVKKYYRLKLRFYISSLLLILNRVRKGKFKLGVELLKITFNK